MAHINTVNFIATKSYGGFDQIEELIAFPDDADGNKAVENVFKERVVADDENCSDADIEASIEDGCYIGNVSGGKFYIVHSTK